VRGSNTIGETCTLRSSEHFVKEWLMGVERINAPVCCLSERERLRTGSAANVENCRTSWQSREQFKCSQSRCVVSRSFSRETPM